MKKRSHKNTRRLTAKERAVAVVARLVHVGNGAYVQRGVVTASFEKALQAHAREAVSRYRRRGVQS